MSFRIQPHSPCTAPNRCQLFGHRVFAPGMLPRKGKL